ncbi:hypothetical protein [Streptomyces sp. NRRL F-5053]|uniref:hypothetical protein n=1 Tax=Streptomyces sp. NRRL F-5053 TaxID=1463854 RepID=UPI0004C9F386|nr:hypothetical protein [Streptomyces sp. NRRL F-5053]
MNGRTAAQAAIYETFGQRDSERTQLIVAAVLNVAEPLIRAQMARELGERVWDRAQELGGVWVRADQVRDAMYTVAAVEAGEEDESDQTCRVCVKPPCHCSCFGKAPRPDCRHQGTDEPG